MTTPSATEGCPRCGSVDTVEVVFGTLADPEAVFADPRSRWGGCELGDHNRECLGCGLVWLAVDGEVLLRSEEELLRVVGVATRSELFDWISERHELDAWEPRTGLEEGLVVAMGTTGTQVEFPLSLDQFTEQIEDLEDLVINGWEDEETGEDG